MLCVLEAILMSTLNTQFFRRRSIDFPELATFASRPGAMSNLHWLELHMYPWLEQFSMVPKVFEPLKFDCSFYANGLTEGKQLLFNKLQSGSPSNLFSFPCLQRLTYLATFVTF